MTRYPIIYLTDIKDTERLFRAVWKINRTYGWNKDTVETSWKAYLEDIHSNGVNNYPWFVLKRDRISAYSRGELNTYTDAIKMNSIPHFIEYVNKNYP